MHDQHGERRPRPGPFNTGRWPHRRTSHVAAALAVLMSLASCGSQPGDTPESAPPPPTGSDSPSQPTPSGTTSATPTQGATPSEPITSPETIATDLQAPWSIAFYRDTPLVSERDTARIFELDDQGQARVVA